MKKEFGLPQGQEGFQRLARRESSRTSYQQSDNWQPRDLLDHPQTRTTQEKQSATKACHTGLKGEKKKKPNSHTGGIQSICSREFCHVSSLRRSHRSVSCCCLGCSETGREGTRENGRMEDAELFRLPDRQHGKNSLPICAFRSEVDNYGPRTPYLPSRVALARILLET